MPSRIAELTGYGRLYASDFRPGALDVVAHLRRLARRADFCWCRLMRTGAPLSVAHRYRDSLYRDILRVKRRFFSGRFLAARIFTTRPPLPYAARWRRHFRRVRLPGRSL